MEQNMLDTNCDELRELAADFPTEIDVIVEMLIDAEEDLCQESRLMSGRPIPVPERHRRNIRHWVDMVLKQSTHLPGCHV